jgi:hypothetical protein
MDRRVFVWLACASFVLSRPAFAVNLVPNPGSSRSAHAPRVQPAVQGRAPNDPNTGTSDAYNQCSPGGFPSVNVPANTFGFQNAHGGVGYGGSWCGTSATTTSTCRRPLTSPLATATTYYVEFWVSLADTSDGAVDRLGAYLQAGPVSVGTNTTLLLTPQVESPAFTYLDDTTNWIKVSGTFVAAGGEDHVVIGNFHDDATTNVQPMPGGYPGINYYVDDVLVEVVTLGLDQACCLPDGSCSMQFPGECTLVGGSPGGTGSTCDPGACGATATRSRTWGAVKTIYR